MPLVSVIIPCYNAGPYLAAALDSVLAQSYRDIEIIVTDDGSTDHSAQILSVYATRGVTVLTQTNSGQCSAANSGFARSTGALIKFFDADDILDQDMIARQVACLGRRTDAIVLGEWRRFYGAQPEDGPFLPLPMYRDAKPVDWLVQEWANARPMMQCGLWLIPREIIERQGLWDTRLSLINDFEFFTRVLLGAQDILFAQGARLHYRSGVGGSLSGRKSRQAVESALASLMLGTMHLLKAENSSRTRRVCANMLQDFEYTYYPEYPDLRAVARLRALELGGASLDPDGPPGFHKLRSLVGWKLARRAERLATKYRRHAYKRT